MKVSSGYMSQLHRGARCPSPRLRERMQQFLGVDFDALFFIQGEGTPDV